MRNVLVFAALFVTVFAGPAASAEAVDDVAAQTAAVPSRLDRLFDDLKRERNERAAERIARGIWQEWAHSGSATIDLLMQWADEAIKQRDFAMALDFLDQVTVLEPDFAEGWNRRATVYFIMNDYAKSMRDINRALQLEPRHFGALSGMATIMRNTGRDRHALDAWLRVLEIYPMMRSAQREVAALAEELAGEGI